MFKKKHEEKKKEEVSETKFEIHKGLLIFCFLLLAIIIILSIVIANIK